MIDRLELAGYVRRRHDRGDRRRVLVELLPRARKLAAELYGSFEAAAGLRRYRPEQLRLLRDFLEGGRTMYEQRVARLQATQKRPASTKEAAHDNPSGPRADVVSARLLAESFEGAAVRSDAFR
jgi:DNA-binding PadR family transcriptional regulator